MPLDTSGGDIPSQGGSYEKKDGKIIAVESHFKPTHADHETGESTKQHQAKQVHVTDIEPKMKGKKTAY